MNRPFADRYEAGRVLAESLRTFEGHADVMVLGLPRGGVPVAYEVSRALGVSFDIYMVRKLGAPGQEELAMGAIASGGIVVINEEVVGALKIPWEMVQAEIARERMELTRRELLYRGNRRRLMSRGSPCFWSTTVLRPDRPCGPRYEPCDGSNRRKSSLPYQRRLPPPSRSFKRSLMPVSLRSFPSRSGPLDCGMRTSIRLAMKRSVICSHGRPRARVLIRRRNSGCSRRKISDPVIPR